MLANTSSCSCTKTTCCERGDFFEFRLPSLWSELLRILEIFLREMITNMTYSDSCPSLDWQTVKVVIRECIPRCENIKWPISSCYLFLEHLDIAEVLKIIITKVILYKISLDLFSKLFLNFWMASDLVYHHLCIIWCRFSSCNVECRELFEHLILRKCCVTINWSLSSFSYYEGL